MATCVETFLLVRRIIIALWVTFVPIRPVPPRLIPGTGTRAGSGAQSTCTDPGACWERTGMGLTPGGQGCQGNGAELFPQMGRLTGQDQSEYKGGRSEPGSGSLAMGLGPRGPPDMVTRVWREPILWVHGNISYEARSFQEGRKGTRLSSDVGCDYI